VPIISVGEIGEGRFRITDKTPLAPLEVTQRLPAFILRRGDIVFGRKGAVDRSCLVNDYEDGWFLGSDGIRLRPSNRIEPKFLGALLQSNGIRSWLLTHSTGTTMATLSHAVLQRLKLPLPPLPEQRAIAEALSDADGLIAALEALIAKKRDLKQAAMQQLLTGKTRLPGFSAEWEVKRLRDLASFFKGKGLPKSKITSSGKFLCIHYGELFTFYGVNIEKVALRTDSNENAFLSRRNDVLMPTSDVTPRGLAKASCLLIDDVILGGDTLVIRPDQQLLSGSFLASQIRFHENQVLKLVTGSTVFHLYASDMRKFEFAAPNIDEQTAIAKVLSDMDADLAALEAQRDKAKEVKQGMMQELLTGRVRLI
jgi:type I restriction enzyme S subunit